VQQYADKDDDSFADEFGRTRQVYYRASLKHLAHALHEWHAEQIPFAVQIGDVVDGYKQDPERSIKDLATVTAAMDQHDSPQFTWFHTVGNHCRYVPRPQLLAALSLETSYYSFCPSSGWRFIVLDGAELCMAAVDVDVAEKEEFATVCSGLGLDPASSSEWNGAMSRAQVEWLEKELEHSATHGETIVVFGHFPLSDKGETASPTSHLLTNHVAVLNLFQKHASSILAYFCGHDHFGASGVCDNIHHVTVPGVLEALDVARHCSVVAARDESGNPLLIIRGTLAPNPNQHRVHVFRKLK